MDTLLRTKLHRPRQRPFLVPRPDLLRKLKQGLGFGPHGFTGKLTLVAAPAGFGKTTLVAAWVDDLQLTIDENEKRQSKIVNLKSVWLSLDAADNDPHRFFTYLAAAIAGLPGVTHVLPGLLQAPQPLPPATLMTAFVQDATAVSIPFLLILDDYHVIDTPALDDALNLLLTHLPAHMHLVITSRTDPALPLARLRARGYLNEIRQLQLRFSTNEAATFLNQVMDLELKPTEVAALAARTEGWIAGLQLAAISLRHQESSDRFIDTFAGSHRYIMDYLADEVLQQQPQHLVDFLLQTAVLNSLTAPLCDAVLEAAAGTSQSILAHLESANLFLIPLDDTRTWYRYHHLFADLLRQRLRQTDPANIPHLHERAAAWFAQQAAGSGETAYVSEALHHARAAGNAAFLTDLLHRFADLLWEQGQHAQLQQAVADLPHTLRAQEPALALYYAWTLLSGGQHDAARVVLDEVEAVLTAVSPPPEQQELQGRFFAARAFLATFAGDTAATIAYAQQALSHLAVRESTWGSSAAMALGDAHSIQGNMAAAAAAYEEAVTLSRVTGNDYLALVGGVKLAMIQRQQGQLHEALRTSRTLLQHAAGGGMDHTAMAGCLMTVAAEIQVEQHHFDGALRQAREGVLRSERGNHVGFLGWSYLNLAQVLLVFGDFDGIRKILQKLDQLQQQVWVPPWIKEPAASLRPLLWLLQGEQAQALAWAAALDVDVDDALLRARQVSYLVAARILLLNGRFAPAATLLNRLHALATASRRGTFLLETTLLQALIAWYRQERNKALQLMQPALEIAQAGGFRHTFAEKGPAMTAMLAEITRQDPANVYAKQLLTAINAVQGRFPQYAWPPLPASADLPEPLSERELEVLHLIAAGLTNKEIAAKLTVSLNTVLYHNKNIYGKLQVKNRAQAVSRARDLRLIEVSKITG